MTTAWIPLATTTLGASATSVTFSSIPAGYRDLTLVVNGKSVSGESYYWLYFNGDTGSNYSRVEMTGTDTSASFGNLIPLTLVSTNPSMLVANIMDYSATDKQKSVIYRSGSVGSGAKLVAGAGRWANTTAINTVKLEGYLSASFAAGTTISLYGSNRL